MTLKVIIIDDQQYFIDMLTELCRSANLQLNIMSTALNANDGFLAIKNINPDLVFLDIEMPGKSGLEMIKEMGERSFDVIFTTSHDKYAVEAFKTEAVDYLLKPVDVFELTTAVERVISRRKEKIMQSTVHTPGNKKITVSTSDGVLFLEVDKLVRLEADNVYTTIYCIDGSKIVASKPLKDFEDRLVNSGFLRIHKSHLVNVNFIKKFYKGDSAYIVMKDDGIVPVSKTGREILQQYEGLL